MRPTPSDAWHALLRPELERSPGLSADLEARMRAGRLTFGDRVHCPYLRPFFLLDVDERRVRHVSETIAALGERVAAAALERPSLLADVGLTEEEERLVRIDPGAGRASTSSRLDAFLLPHSLEFAEYNAESPAGAAYSEMLGHLFESLPVMARFREQFEVRAYPLVDRLLDALLESYREWGGRAAPPTIAIVDFRGVPTWTEFELLQARFEARGVPTVVADPGEVSYEGGRLIAGGRPVDLLYRRLLVNDLVAHPEASAPLLRAYVDGAVCMVNALRCKVPHKKAFFAVLTDERHRDLFTDGERELVARHVPWTRLVREGPTARGGDPIDLIPYVRSHRAELVLKPNDEYGGSGVTLGWERSEREWDEAIAAALAAPAGAWVVQSRIGVRREVFPRFDASGVEMQDVLVDFAPYLFRGRLAGFLTRLSATGLANVTSGGGQVPAFVVRPREERVE